MGAVLQAAARLLIAAVTIAALAVAVCGKADADAGQYYFIDFVRALALLSAIRSLSTGHSTSMGELSSPTTLGSRRTVDGNR